MKAIEGAGYKPGDDVMLALDCAATEFYKGGKYAIEGEGKSLDSAGMAKYLAGLVGALSRSCPSRTAWPRTTGRAGRR